MDVVAAGVPEWLTTNADAWFVLPLLHAEALVGAIVLARSPVERALDWEDFDLLRVAGRQAASFLAEDRLRTALDEARRFDEFNRRFAFLLHDIKNVASQLTLVARNAERHADNAEFRSDMVATLKDSSGRMATLLSRLGQHDGARPEPAQPVDVATLIGRVVAARRAQHPVTSDLATAPLVLAQPLRLEQVLSHLIQNAVEASATDRAVTISIERTEDDVAIVVADRGSGMSADFVRDELFRPFVSTKPGGFGIGAYEARQLVVGMGGQLTVESRVGEGTRFRIVLPVVPALEVAA
jgi:putative PEP-CTERM system histidine kinase